MTAAQYIGIAMVATPFIAVFAAATATIGLRGALGVLGLTGAIVAFFVVGTTLIGDQYERTSHSMFPAVKDYLRRSH